jgi:hypothetical protein
LRLGYEIIVNMFFCLKTHTPLTLGFYGTVLTLGVYVLA